MNPVVAQPVIISPVAEKLIGYIDSKFCGSGDIEAVAARA